MFGDILTTNLIKSLWSTILSSFLKKAYVHALLKRDIPRTNCPFVLSCLPLSGFAL